MVVDIAERQHGVVSRGQLLNLGLSESGLGRLVDAGWLRRLHRGVYSAGHRALTRNGRLMGATLACGPGAVISHQSAAALWDLRASERARIDVSVAATGGARLSGIARHTTRRLEPGEVDEIDRVPVTSVARTLADLAGCLSWAHLRRTMERADGLQLLDVDAVLLSSSHRPGAPRIRAILDDWAPAATHDGLEELLLDLVVRSGLPTPQVNVWVHGFEVDQLWAEARLVVEADSRSFHNSWDAAERDRQRDAVLAARGYRVLRFTWKQVTRRPVEVVAAVRHALHAAPAPNRADFRPDSGRF